MMEKLGQAKTHLELKKMIAEVDTNGSGNFVCTYMLVNSYGMTSDHAFLSCCEVMSRKIPLTQHFQFASLCVN